MLLRAQRWKGEGALLGIRATLPKGVFMATSHNSGHTATLRSAKIRQSRNSYVRRTLSEIAGDGVRKRQKKRKTMKEVKQVRVVWVTKKKKNAHATGCKV